MKPGFLTSEFWLIALTVIGVLAGTYAGKLPPELGAVVFVILPSFWTWIRDKAKAEHAAIAGMLIARVAPPAVSSQVRAGLAASAVSDDQAMPPTRMGTPEAIAKGAADAAEHWRPALSEALSAPEPARTVETPPALRVLEREEGGII